MGDEQTPLFAVVKWGDGTSGLEQLPPSGMYDDMVQDKYVRYSDYAALEQEREPLKVKLSTLVSVTERAKKAEAEVERLRAEWNAAWYALNKVDNILTIAVTEAEERLNERQLRPALAVIERTRAALTKPEGE